MAWSSRSFRLIVHAGHDGEAPGFIVASLLRSDFSGTEVRLNASGAVARRCCRPVIAPAVVLQIASRLLTVADCRHEESLCLRAVCIDEPALLEASLHIHVADTGDIGSRLGEAGGEVGCWDMEPHRAGVVDGLLHLVVAPTGVAIGIPEVIPVGGTPVSAGTNETIGVLDGVGEGLGTTHHLPLQTVGGRIRELVVVLMQNALARQHRVLASPLVVGGETEGGVLNVGTGALRDAEDGGLAAGLLHLDEHGARGVIDGLAVQRHPA